jgi:hypothetical protein
MADTVNLQVIAPTLPPGSCIDPAVPQLIGKTQVLFPSEYGLTIKSPNEPTVDQRDFVWFKTDSISGEIVGRFTWSGLYGLWIQPHFGTAGVPTNERRLFVGSLTLLELYDGGETGTATETRGPFWEQDTDFNDKLVIGATTTAASTAAVGEDTTQKVDFSAGSTPVARGVYIIKPTGRVYDRSS